MTRISVNEGNDDEDKLFIHDRWNRILKLINSNTVTSIEKLSDALNVSQATIRRDLNRLDEIGELNRVRGGAIALKNSQDEHSATHSLLGQADHSESSITNVKAKRAIGEHAATLIDQGEAIILSGGTTTVELARAVNSQKLTVLTTSISILNALFGKPDIRIMITGGEVFQEQKIVLNPYGDSIIKKFAATKIFIGAQAITRQGVLQTDPLLVHYEQDLIDRAEQVIVLADSSKFDTRGSLSVCGLDRIDKVVTDDKISDQALAMLKENDIEVIKIAIN
ncbi:MAG: DeoR/GlpR transcriptional regulator [Kordiimonadaceae bacterium]|jgi:DeoR family transcriptional regulator, ulaG and ulaABCDEF operon transcriptional repressor|nr:DeoR/GlpR transcriptional regulator [Kordiimonadaceae bacterium]MBT6032517.1 DeoR/GlpR transcriptional regulator [Kordiimonadaceae bacterium]